MGKHKAPAPPPSLVQLPHTGRDKKTHLSVALSMSPLCAAVFQGTWSVFSHNEINSAANCAAASGGGGSSSRAEPRHRGDKADQTPHIVRSLSLIYLCTLGFYVEVFNPVAVPCAKNGGLQSSCNIDVPYLRLVGNVPEDLSKFSVYSAEPDLSWQWPQSAYRYTGLDGSVPLISHFPLGTIKSVNEPLRCVLDQSVTYAVLSCLLRSF